MTLSMIQSLAPTMALCLPFYWRIDWLRIAEIANTYSNLIIAVLTVAIVVATGFSTWITYRTLLEVQEDRLGEIRPLIWFKMASPELSQEARDPALCPNRVTIRSAVMISNHGRGSAINVRILQTLPPFLYSEGVKERSFRFGSSSLQVPQVFNALETLSGEDEFVDCTDIADVLRTESWTDPFYTYEPKLEVLWEDVGGNLYSLVQRYHLIARPFLPEGEDGVNISYQWRIAKEALYFCRFADRRAPPEGRSLREEFDQIDQEAAPGRVRILHARTGSFGGDGA